MKTIKGNKDQTIKRNKYQNFLVTVQCAPQNLKEKKILLVADATKYNLQYNLKEKGHWISSWHLNKISTPLNFTSEWFWPILNQVTFKKYAVSLYRTVHTKTVTMSGHRWHYTPSFWPRVVALHGIQCFQSISATNNKQFII